MGLTPDLKFLPTVPGEKGLVSVERHRPLSRVVLGNPCQQELEIGVLGLFGRVFVRFPRAASAVVDAALKPRVQKNQSRLKLQRRRDQVAVAALYYPALMGVAEACDIRLGQGAWPSYCGLIWNPGNRVEIQDCQVD